MLRVTDAELLFPANCETPVAAQVVLESNDTPVRLELDFLHAGTPSWDIKIDTAGGELRLLAGGRIMEVDGRVIDTPAIGEYPALYAHFADLVHNGVSDVDVSPLQLVADALLCGRRKAVDAFFE
jgi:D-galactose 1-dehydrogenase